MTTAAVIPFPLARRRFIAKQARMMIRRSPDAAERYLRQQLEGQAATMAKRGIPEDMIGRELREAESAIRAEIWRLVMCGRADEGA